MSEPYHYKTVCWPTTPTELRKIALDMEQQAATIRAGESTRIATILGNDTNMKLEIHADQDYVLERQRKLREP
jgi:hypothetical protein